MYKLPDAIHKKAASWNPSTFGDMINVEPVVARD
jgi:hypothetical protein